MSYFDFLRSEHREVRGVVERVGLHNSYGIIGINIILEGLPQVFTILNGEADPVLPVGLTCAGDEVFMLADDRNRVSTKNFQNLTLSRRLADAAPQRP